MANSTINRTLFIGLAATVCLLLAYSIMPARKISLIPEHRRQAFVFPYYASENPSARVFSHWINEETVNFRCTVPQQAPTENCGIYIMLTVLGTKGIDLSNFDKISFKIKSNGNNKTIRLNIRTFLNNYSKLNDFESTVLQNVMVHTRDINNTVEFGLTDFYLAEWWYANHDVPRSKAVATLHNVHAIGVELFNPPAGIHELQVLDVTAVGKWISREQWYLGILISWILLISFLGILQYFTLQRRLKEGLQKLRRVSRDNRELRFESQRYKRLSHIDKLTGVLNRFGFESVIADLKKDLPDEDELGLILLDVDHFKSINDKHGHDVGDTILVAIAQVLSHNIRQSDSLARWGGEEFIIVCPSIDKDNLRKLAEKIRLAIANYVFYMGEETSHVTISAGASIFGSSEDYLQVFKRVDKALYTAKHDGRNRVQLSD